MHNISYRGDIQGLRALAFLLVYIFHLAPDTLTGGFIGVDVFFVISGFLMAKIIQSERRENTFSLKDFYWKRAKRILPAYYSMMIAVIIAFSFVLLYTDIPYLNHSIYGASLFASNLVFAKMGSYFGPGFQEHPLLHTWSLAMEIQFYLIVPFLFIRNKINIPRIWFFIAAIGVLTCYTFYQIYFGTGRDRMYFSLIARIPEFLIGSVAGILSSNGFSFSKKSSLYATFFGLGLLLSSALFLKPTMPFPAFLALPPTLGTALLLLSAPTYITILLSNRAAQYIGKLSYSLYLWHWPVLAYVRYTTDRDALSWVEICWISAVVFVLAWLSYVLIEQKYREVSHKRFGYHLGIALLTLIGCTLAAEPVARQYKIPDIYTQPTVGLTSHFSKTFDLLGDSTVADTDILLFGDSYALCFKSFFDYLGNRHQFAFRTISSDCYPPIKGISKEDVGQHMMRYHDYAQSLIDTVYIEIDKSRIIIFCTNGLTTVSSLVSATERLAQQLRPDQHLIITTPFPALDKNPIRALKSHVKKGNPTFEIIHRDLPEAIKGLGNKYPNVHIYDITKSKIFADAPFFRDTVMYYDDQHLNTYGSLELAKDLEDDFMLFLKSLP